jgi:hypothetical protein
MSGLQNKRYAVTMWDFSWLTRRQGNEAEYADWDKVLDEAVVRGYSCIRIDAFPHLIASVEEQNILHQSFTILPEPFSAQWGNKVPVNVNPGKGLIEFLQKCKKRNLKVGLSTWFNPDSADLRNAVKTPHDFYSVWNKTLLFIIHYQLEDIILWVDLCNEFPFVAWSPQAHNIVFSSSPKNIFPFFKSWNKAEVNRVDAYLIYAITKLKADFPHLNFTFSSMHISKWNFFKSDYSACDLAEPHVWLTDSFLFNVLSLGFLSMAQLPGGERIHSLLAPLYYKGFKAFWLKTLGKEMQELANWSKQHNKPLITSEGWATVMYGGTKQAQNAAYWDWVKDINEHAVRMAIEKGWTGICTSNFSQPHFRAMWDDVAWHQRLTLAIKRSGL